MEKFSLEFATAIAESAHEGQVDKNDVPYIFHPLGVMDMVQGEDAKTVALLHDVLEDSDLTPNDLRELGCPDHVLVAVELVTHGLDYDDTHEGYFRDIQRIADSKNQLAIDVKFADIIIFFTLLFGIFVIPKITQRTIHKRFLTGNRKN